MGSSTPEFRTLGVTWCDDVRLHHACQPETGVEAFVAVSPLEDRVAFGGLRIAESVTADCLLDLARAMRWKYALHAIPMGGAKGGLRCAPEQAREGAIDGFARWAAPLLRTEVILGRDLGSSNELLDRCYAELGTPQLELVQRHHSSCPPRIRDLLGYVPHMTGRGVAWATDAALRHIGEQIRGARVLVQGAGRVGFGSAFRLAELGAALVGISDRHLALYHRDGLPLDELSACIDAEGSLDPECCGFSHAVLDRDALLGQEAEILVLAANSRLVTPELAATVRVQVVAEGANDPLCDGAEEVLEASGCLVLPDIAANSSSAALVGHQLSCGSTRPPDALWADIKRSIREAVERALADAERPGLSPRTALIRALEADPS